jgi:hypothetical protein
MRGERARNLARDANLIVMRIAEYGAVRVRDGVLEVGPDAPPDAIATVACRHLLAREGESSERCVQSMVESLGYEYSPQREQRIRTSSSGVAYRAVS